MSKMRLPSVLWPVMFGNIVIGTGVTITAITPWLHYAGQALDPIRRSPNGSSMRVGDSARHGRPAGFCKRAMDLARNARRHQTTRSASGGWRISRGQTESLNWFGLTDLLPALSARVGLHPEPALVAVFESTKLKRVFGKV